VTIILKKKLGDLLRYELTIGHILKGATDIKT